MGSVRPRREAVANNDQCVQRTVSECIFSQCKITRILAGLRFRLAAATTKYYSWAMTNLFVAETAEKTFQLVRTYGVRQVPKNRCAVNRNQANIPFSAHLANSKRDVLLLGALILYWAANVQRNGRYWSANVLLASEQSPGHSRVLDLGWTGGSSYVRSKGGVIFVDHFLGGR